MKPSKNELLNRVETIRAVLVIQSALLAIVRNSGSAENEQISKALQDVQTFSETMVERLQKDAEQKDDADE